MVVDAKSGICTITKDICMGMLELQPVEKMVLLIGRADVGFGAVQ